MSGPALRHFVFTCIRIQDDVTVALRGGGGIEIAEIQRYERPLDTNILPPPVISYILVTFVKSQDANPYGISIFETQHLADHQLEFLFV